MKHLLLTTIAAVVLVGCGESQQSAPAPEAKPAEPVAETAKLEPPAAKASDIDIHEAVEEGDIEAIKQCLAAGADVNKKSASGLTALHRAALGGRAEVWFKIAELLIAKGADTNAKSELGETPLDYANGVENGLEPKRYHSSEVKAVLKKISNLLRQHGGKKGSFYSIHLAAKGDIEAVKRHLTAKADVNAKNKTGATPLHFATNYGQLEIVELLISKGADVNAKDHVSITPLHLVPIFHNHQLKIAGLLIAKGANVNAKSDVDETPLDWAVDNAHKEIADLLRKHGGKTGEELKTEGK